ncbi:hypothetical protein SELMODRAFT_14639, partial [Selaginella moellendorffii]
IVSRDVTIDDGLGLWARIFLPKRLKGECVDPNALKSPVLMYFHGGGFVAMSASFFGFHDFCEEISRWLGVLVVSVEYRLAPENRLPVAYEDGFAALKWLGQDQGGLSDPWLAAHADLSSVFLVGDSSGANLAQHLSVRAAAPASWGDLGPVRIVGRVLIQPTFASVARKPSGMLRDDPSKVSPSTLMMDRFWELALPIGASRDHPFCNIAVARGDLAGILLPRTLVVVGGLDVLRDHGVEYSGILRECGKNVKLVEFESCDHAFYLNGSTESTSKLM